MPQSGRGDVRATAGEAGPQMDGQQFGIVVRTTHRVAGESDWALDLERTMMNGLWAYNPVNRRKG